MPGILTVPMCIGCSFDLISAGTFPRLRARVTCLLLSPTASFLSAAKEKRKRNAAKNYVFGFPYAASPDFSLVEISHANVVPWKLHRNIALSLLLGALPLLL